MRFIDANLFIYALLKPKKEPPENVRKIKKKAKDILRRISKGEKVITTVVHLSEVANVLESRASRSFAAEFVRTVLISENI